MASGNQSDTHLFRPEDVAADDLPVAVRGYDRHAVDRRLARVADSYARLLRQRDELREWLEAAEARVTAAEDEAKVSAREVAALTQRTLAADEELSGLRRRVGELEAALDAARAQTGTGVRPSRRARRPSCCSRRAAPPSNCVERPARRLDSSCARRRREPMPSTATPIVSVERWTRRRNAPPALAAKAEQQQRAVEEATARVAALSAEAESQSGSADEARVRRVDAEREAQRLVEQARADAERGAGSARERAPQGADHARAGARGARGRGAHRGRARRPLLAAAWRRGPERLVGARPGSARADPGRAKIPEGGRIPLHVKP